MSHYVLRSQRVCLITLLKALPYQPNWWKADLPELLSGPNPSSCLSCSRSLSGPPPTWRRMFTTYLTIFVVHYANLKSRVANLRKSRNKSSLLAQTLRISIIHNHKAFHYLDIDGRFMFDLLNGDLRVREDHSRHDEDQWSWQWVGIDGVRYEARRDECLGYLQYCKPTPLDSLPHSDESDSDWSAILFEEQA
ncbi:hypothetical protein PCH_Pc22g15160 [Penicillium rubens Wisconsin 54-1255]|uniref:Uncharacterized protein n=1 Tax=Penicillium rubens (strain ATCC 28089 / DSM 1075 / NRRL 1951 / Wisconsin 54-1255) TaxID=500485 RepID=B6HVN5_PENRW|nr:hypothetical protein PCH_Pc22g15160 [Penicillium rubens Wisconsin 54-1255]